MTYHGYPEIPEKVYPSVKKLREVILRYSNDIQLIQGENGAPSQMGPVGALSEIAWTELKQAKWNLRRMMGDFKRSIPSNIFTIADLKRPPGWNYKGLLHVDRHDSTIIGKKKAFKAMQHVTSIFDDNIRTIQPSEHNINKSIDIEFFSFSHIKTLDQGIALWQNNEKPSGENLYKIIDFTAKQVSIENAVLVDLLDGMIYEVDSSVNSKANETSFFSIPVYDSPILIVEKDLIM